MSRVTTFGNNRAQVFTSGIYYLDAGITFGAGSSFTGNQVLFYVKGGRLQTTGNGSMNFTPPDSGTYKGILVFQARGNATKLDLGGGNGSAIFGGGVYLPSAELDLTGGQAVTFKNFLIVNALTIGGHGNMDVDSTVGSSSGRPYLIQ